MVLVQRFRIEVLRAPGRAAEGDMLPALEHAVEDDFGQVAIVERCSPGNVIASGSGKVIASSSGKVIVARSAKVIAPVRAR